MVRHPHRLLRTPCKKSRKEIAQPVAELLLCFLDSRQIGITKCFAIKSFQDTASSEEARLYLAIDNYRHVDVTIKDDGTSYNGRVEFSSRIDQSYLPELIEQQKSFIWIYR